MDPITVNNAPRKLFLLPRIINYKQISCAISTINFNVLTFQRMQECDSPGDVVIKDIRFDGAGEKKVLTIISDLFFKLYNITLIRCNV